MRTIERFWLMSARKEVTKRFVDEGDTPTCKVLRLPFTLRQRPGLSANEALEHDPTTFVLHPSTTLNTKVIRLFCASPQIA